MLGLGTGDRAWRAAFIAGLILAPVAGILAGYPVPLPQMPASWPVIVVAGLLVGFGARLGGGCTSGHGVCGMARLSKRSIAATMVFMAAAVVVVALMRHVVGGWAMLILACLVSGFIFGLGLLISGMTQPAKVLGFLDIFGAWDPSLAVVMAAALAVSGVGYMLAQQRSAPVLAQKFDIPTRTDIDAPLIAGSALFGIGWGLVGLCPGPALENLATLSPQVIVFCIAMAVGMVAHDQWYAKRPAAPTPGVLAGADNGYHPAAPPLTAVDHQRRAGDEAASVGGEQQQRAIEIARLAEAADRNLALDRRRHARLRDSRGSSR